MESSSVSAEDQRPGIMIEGERGMPDDASNQRVLYTIPGVLHFLQTECARMEAERAQFELERTEFQARIAFLEGERRAQDNLKKDLVRRIRMLEHALAKERERTQGVTVQSSAQPDNDENRSSGKSSDGNEELARLGLSAQPVEDLEELLQNLGQTKSQKARSQMIAEGRQLLRKYLQEIGYADTIVDVRSARVRALLGLEPTSAASNNRAPSGNMQNGAPRSPSPLPPPPPMPLTQSQPTSGARQGNAQYAATPADRLRLPEEVVASAEQSVLDTFAFLRSSELSSGTGTAFDDGDDTGLGPELRRVLRPKRDGETESVETFEEAAALNELNGLLNNASGSTTRDSALLAVRLNEAEMSGETDEEANNTTILGGPRGANDSSPRSRSANSQQQSARPEVRFVLRSHYDAVRAIVFHPTEAAIVSASDDSTVKLWSLDRQNQGSLSSSPSPQLRRGGQSIAPSVVSDLEPLQTFRSHCAPVLCAALGSGGDRLYTGGVDGGLACYSLHSMLASINDIYDPWDSTRALAYISNAHNDAIWRLAAHPTRHSLLATCGADCAIRLWNVGDDGVLNSSEDIDTSGAKVDGESGVSSPTNRCSPVLLRMMNVNDKSSFSSLDFSRVEYTQLVASSVIGNSSSQLSSSLHVFDFETGAEVARIENICSSGIVNEVVSHPTLPLAALACDDGFIRIVDLAAAAALFPASPLPDSIVVATLPTPAPVSSVAIDQTGVYLLAGCHDGSVRLWNLETRACLFDDTVAHHRKFDEGVLSVAIHPSRPLFASAGADGAVRIYRW